MVDEDLLALGDVAVVGRAAGHVEMVAPAGDLKAVIAPLRGELAYLHERKISPLSGEESDRSAAHVRAPPVLIGSPLTYPLPRPRRPHGCTGTYLAQAASWKTRARVNRRPDLIVETPWRTGAADQPRADRTGRSRVVKTSPWPCGMSVAVPRDWARGRCS